MEESDGIASLQTENVLILNKVENDALEIESTTNTDKGESTALEANNNRNNEEDEFLKTGADNEENLPIDELNDSIDLKLEGSIADDCSFSEEADIKIAKPEESCVIRSQENSNETPVEGGNFETSDYDTNLVTEPLSKEETIDSAISESSEKPPSSDTLDGVAANVEGRLVDGEARSVSPEISYEQKESPMEVDEGSQELQPSNDVDVVKEDTNQAEKPEGKKDDSFLIIESESNSRDTTSEGEGKEKKVSEEDLNGDSGETEVKEVKIKLDADAVDHKELVNEEKFKEIESLVAAFDGIGDHGQYTTKPVTTITYDSKKKKKSDIKDQRKIPKDGKKLESTKLKINKKDEKTSSPSLAKPDEKKVQKARRTGGAPKGDSSKRQSTTPSDQTTTDASGNGSNDGSQSDGWQPVSIVVVSQKKSSNGSASVANTTDEAAAVTSSSTNAAPIVHFDNQMEVAADVAAVDSAFIPTAVGSGRTWLKVHGYDKINRVTGLPELVMVNRDTLERIITEFDQQLIRIKGKLREMYKVCDDLRKVVLTKGLQEAVLTPDEASIPVDVVIKASKIPDVEGTVNVSRTPNGNYCLSQKDQSDKRRQPTTKVVGVVLTPKNNIPLTAVSESGKNGNGKTTLLTNAKCKVQFNVKVLPKDIVRALTNGDVLTPSQRQQFIDKITMDVIKAKGVPSAKQIQEIAMQVANMYPRSLVILPEGKRRSNLRKRRGSDDEVEENPPKKARKEDNKTQDGGADGDTTSASTSSPAIKKSAGDKSKTPASTDATPGVTSLQKKRVRTSKNGSATTPVKIKPIVKGTPNKSPKQNTSGSTGDVKVVNNEKVDEDTNANGGESLPEVNVHDGENTGPDAKESSAKLKPLVHPTQDDDDSSQNTSQKNNSGAAGAKKVIGRKSTPGGSAEKVKTARKSITGTPNNSQAESLIVKRGRSRPKKSASDGSSHGESNMSLQEQKEWLYEDFLKPPEVQDLEKQHLYLHNCYDLLYKEMAEKDYDVAAITMEWPILKVPQHTLSIFKRLKLVHGDFQKLIRQDAPKLVTFFHNKVTGDDAAEWSLMISKAKPSNKFHLPEEVGVMPLLALNFDEDFSLLFRLLPDKEAFREELSKIPPTPIILGVGNSIFDCEYNVVVEQELLFTPETYLDALELVYASYFVFNLAYPKELVTTLEYVQRTYVGYNPAIKHVTLMKTKPKLAAFMKKLKDFERLDWNSNNINLALNVMETADSDAPMEEDHGAAAEKDDSVSSPEVPDCFEKEDEPPNEEPMTVDPLEELSEVLRQEMGVANSQPMSETL